MKRKERLFAGALLLAFSSILGWPQGYTGGVQGVVTQNKQPAPNLQVVLTSNTTSKQYKTKTDKKGEYFLAGIIIDEYVLKLVDANGAVLYVNDRKVRLHGNDVIPLDIDLSNPEASRGRVGTPADAEAQPASSKMTKEQQKAEAARIKADNERIASMNEFIKQYQTAAQAQQWGEAEKALKQLLAVIPDTTRWEFYQRLGDAQDRNNEQADALRNLDKGIEIAQAIIAGKAPSDPHNPNPDPAKAKAGIGQMMVAEGNIYVKLGTPELATPLFAQATQDNPSPALAYYNLCAAEFNSNKLDAAVAACDRSLAADPSRAEAWFLKGSALYKIGKTDSSKVAVEALNKYLELDPNGQHANDAKSILQAVAQK
ncbi:MAG TPA: tetratricopeptide repeat protein [Candidatus Angelobacter sp.]